MERRSFFRPADFNRTMSPVSDSEREVFADAPRMAARSVALIAKKRQAHPEVQPARRKGQEVWADLLTDDEENFPSWEPKIQGLGVPATQGLLWDPLGLQGDLSPVSDLLFNKMAGEKQLHPRTNSTAFDKWSWSTTATEADSTLPPLQEESSPTGVGSGKTSETEPEASQASQVQEEQPLL
ncbi:unnamed protein product, partial [Durusdinium trenchii]